jgi:hypothetical protein
MPWWNYRWQTAPEWDPVYVEHLLDYLGLCLAGYATPVFVKSPSAGETAGRRWPVSGLSCTDVGARRAFGALDLQGSSGCATTEHKI